MPLEETEVERKFASGGVDAAPSERPEVDWRDLRAELEWTPIAT